MTRIIKFFIDNPVAANILMIFLLVGGFYYSYHIKQEVFPEYTIDEVVVQVSYPGATPKEIENGIILPIEEAIDGLEGIDKVISTAREGVGTVTIEAVNGADINQLYNDVKNAVDRITTFPADAEKPTIYIPTRKRAVITMILYGDVPYYQLMGLAQQYKDRLLNFKNITNVELSGNKPYQITISVSENALKKYSLTFSDIARKIRDFDTELGGGRIRTRGGDILIKTGTRKEYGSQLANIPIITTSGGGVVKLKDIAKIDDGFEDTDTYLKYNGKRAIGITVYRVGDQKPVEIADTVKAFIARIRDELPPGIGVDYVSDYSRIFKQRKELLLKNAKFGLVLVLILLALFLELRLAFWVMLGIPVSFLGSMLIFPMFGVTINMISMFAFIICLGIVVDDAIVVGENIYSYREKGLSFKEAALVGTREVFVPVVFSVLTNMVAFLPMYFVPGTAGKIFRIIPVIVCSVFTISLLESLFILPSHIAHQRENPILPIRAINRVQGKISKIIHRLINLLYTPVLKLALRFRYVVFVLAAVILYLAFVFVETGKIGIVYFPRIERSHATVRFQLPPESSVYDTLKIADMLVQRAKRIIKEHGGSKLAQGILTRIDGNSGDIRVYLTPPGVRPISTSQFTRLWRRASRGIPGLEKIRFSADFGGPGAGASLTIELSHRNTAVLTQACKQLANYLKTFKNVSDIDDGTSAGKYQFTLTLNSLGRALGLDPSYIATQLRGAYYGIEAKKFIRQGNEVKIKVTLPEQQRSLVYYFDHFMLTLPDGTRIPLKEVVNVEKGRSYVTITREDFRRVMYVTANVTPERDTRKIVENLMRDFLPKLKQHYPGLSYSFGGRQSRLKESMSVLTKGLLVSVLVIFTMLAIPFKSYIQPIIIMTAIPFGIIGAIIGHVIMGYDISIVSMFGIVALCGVVINDSLVLIDFANRIRRTLNKSHYEAVFEAGIKRFRPIILTTLTTFFGLMPMIFEPSTQARFLVPMAISLGFGILFSTFIILILVPGLYLIVEDIANLFGFTTK